ncbi:MAG: hypothetical protein GY856_27105 [bacterium]|nr:hypothetical protein [bacterium]
MPRPAQTTAAPSGVLTLDEAQRRHILEVLERYDWRVSGDNGAADLLGMRPITLESRIKKLSIRRK